MGTINGYHYFQIRPLMGIEFPLTCVREPENSFDNNAFKAMAPRVREVSLHVLDLTVRPNPIQTVRKICGKPVGRMPASLAKLINFIILAILHSPHNIIKENRYHFQRFQKHTTKTALFDQKYTTRRHLVSIFSNALLQVVT